MIGAVLIVGLISYFNLKWVYKNCSTAQSILLTLLFAGVLLVCGITAAGIVIRSPIVILGDLMKSIGLSYPPMP